MRSILLRPSRARREEFGQLVGRGRIKGAELNADASLSFPADRGVEYSLFGKAGKTEEKLHLAAECRTPFESNEGAAQAHVGASALGGGAIHLDGHG